MKSFKSINGLSKTCNPLRKKKTKLVSPKSSDTAIDQSNASLIRSLKTLKL